MSRDPATIARLLRRAAVSGWTVRASGGSMHPQIRAGELLQVEALNRRPRTGEIWVFINSAGLVTAHRYLRRTRSGRFVFFGDAVGRADVPVPSAWIVGRVVAIGDGCSQRRPRRSAGIGPIARIGHRSVRRRCRDMYRRART